MNNFALRYQSILLYVALEKFRKFHRKNSSNKTAFLISTSNECETNSIKQISERNKLVFFSNLKYNSCSFYKNKSWTDDNLFYFFMFILFEKPLFDESSRKNWVLLSQTTFAFEVQLYIFLF